MTSALGQLSSDISSGATVQHGSAISNDRPRAGCSGDSPSLWQSDRFHLLFASHGRQVRLASRRCPHDKVSTTASHIGSGKVQRQAMTLIRMEARMKRLTDNDGMFQQEFGVPDRAIDRSDPFYDLGATVPGGVSSDRGSAPASIAAESGDTTTRTVDPPTADTPITAAAPPPADAGGAVTVREADPAVNGGRLEVVFIESNVPDIQVLVNGVKPGVEVVLLEASRDGLAQMAGYLEGRTDIDAIHIVSHGA
ncbi:MAG: DUF4347 domain-containing protein, partial [Methylococcaceae bacterium]|nr:DUF4347 domain-containing protein [Methylococcaceae bacterium]